MDPAVAKAAPMHAQTSARPGQGLVFTGVLLCFLLSGFAALVYQTAWMRQFSIVFGTSELAVATVLAAYMGGLALGSAIAARVAHRIQRPVLVYGLLELGIALGALAVPYGLGLARSAQTAIIGGQASPPDAGAISQSLFYLLVTFAIIVIPTGFMGATLPILTRQAVRNNEQVGPRIGLLYAINTAGAVAGALIAAFLLLPRLGLTQTVWVGVAANALIFIVTLFLSSAMRSGAAAVPTQVAGLAPPGRRWWILPLILASGI
ncbi:MAG: spermidine synthase, partial [Gammaproteobacteria bacterium]